MDFAPLLKVLPDIVREVGLIRRARLNCWARESLRTCDSQRNVKFRKKVIKFYQRQIHSGKSVKCQILDECVRKEDASDENTGIIAAHIWKASTRGHGLQEFGLRVDDINSPRNGLFLTKGLEEAFDRQQVCFLYNLLRGEFVLWVVDTTISDKTIQGSDKTFGDVHGWPLACPPNCAPFRRLLSWHARLSLRQRTETAVLTTMYTAKYDNSPDRNTAVMDPFDMAVEAIIEAGDEASVREARDTGDDDDSES